MVINTFELPNALRLLLKLIKKYTDNLINNDIPQLYLPKFVVLKLILGI